MTKIAGVVAALAVVGCVPDHPVGQATQATTGSGFTDAGTDGGSGGGGGTFHATSNGHQAQSGYFDPATGAGGGVTVFENGVGAARTVYLVFFFSGPDPSSQVCTTYTDPWWGEITQCYYTRYVFENGAGSIPSGDFSTTPKSARLHTTTTASFQGEICTEDFTAGTFTCGPNQGESFDLAWNATGTYSSYQSGVSEQTWGRRTARTQGTFRTTSAATIGTAAGHSFSTANGAISDSKGVTIQHDVF